MSATGGSQFGEVYAPDREVWRAWLAQNHATAPGAWLNFYKKSSGKTSVTLIEAIEEALCFGWVDSKMRRIDSERYVLMFTPRKAKSPWSPGNKERVARLMEQGRMAPAGMAAVEAAKADGRWDVYLDTAERPMPDDLAAALAANPAAGRHFAKYGPGARRELIRWVATAKRAETRQKRIATILTAAREGRNPLA
ncbi:MAG TPA: YdeI/OmpD-associated family protein [Ktedonobacterales bacterium]